MIFSQNVGKHLPVFRNEAPIFGPKKLVILKDENLMDFSQPNFFLANGVCRRFPQTLLYGWWMPSMEVRTRGSPGPLRRRSPPRAPGAMPGRWVTRAPGPGPAQQQHEATRPRRPCENSQNKKTIDKKLDAKNEKEKQRKVIANDDVGMTGLNL